MIQPEAGWYTDPEDDNQLRWWNGAGWADQRKVRLPQAAPVTAPPASVTSPYVPMGGYVPMAGHGSLQTSVARPSRAEKDRETRKNNSMAYTGLFLSLLALLINPFALLSILGVVFSAVGLAKSHELAGAGHRTTGKGTAAWGIVVGILGLVLFGWLAFR